MNDAPPPEAPLPPDLRFLKLLVVTLTGVMIVGLVVIVALLVIRLQPVPPVMPALPEHITLPDGAGMQAVTFARDWIVVVTEAGEILLYDAESGNLRRRVGTD